MPESARTWSESDSQRWLVWLARALRRSSRTVFLLEELQPTWLSRPGAYYLMGDALLGAAIGALVAPLAVVIPAYFGPGQSEAPGITAIMAVVLGGVLGALTSRMSLRSAERYSDVAPPIAPAEAIIAAIAAEPPDADPTVLGTERAPSDSKPRKKEGWGCGWGCGLLHLLSFAGLALGGVLLVLNWLMSLRFANMVGLRNALTVLFVLIAIGFYRAVEAHRLRASRKFIRPAEALGWSARDSVRTGVMSVVLALLIALPAARLLDGWLGNRQEASIELQGRGFEFHGPYGLSAHFLGLSDQGVALLLFLWMTIVVAGFALGGLRSRVIHMKTRPNQGMRLSARNAFLCLWAVGLPAGALLGIGLLFIRPVAAGVPFVRTPGVVPVEVLAQRLYPAVANLIREFPPVKEPLPALEQVHPSARRDSLRAWLRVAPPGQETVILQYLFREQMNDTQAIALELATAINRDRRALLRGTYSRSQRSLSMPAKSIANEARRPAIQETVDRLFVPVPPDSMPASMRAAQSKERDVELALRLGLALGVAIGGLAALLHGGMAVVRHYLLRLRMARDGVAPVDYSRFLDYAADRLGFLQRVGGGYMFIHRMLLDYFADEPAQLRQ